MHTLELQGIDLTRAVVEGDGDAVALIREALLKGSGTDPIEHALIAAERAMAAACPDGRGSTACLDIAGRLRGAARALSEALDPVAVSVADAAGTVTLASLPGDIHDVGRHLWRAVMVLRGHRAPDLGVLAPALVARRVAAARPDALGVYVMDHRGRPAVQSLVDHLLRRGAETPVLLSGPGVDQDFAVWVSVPTGADHYWPGVNYCEDTDEALEVLRQIVLYEPPPQIHEHDHDPYGGLDACGGCCDCALQTDCDLQA